MKKYFVVILSAVLSSLPFTFPNLFVLTLIAPSIFFYYLFKARTNKDSVLMCIIWPIVYYLGVHYYFIALYPLDFAGLSPAASLGVVALGWIGISVFQGLELGVFLFAFKKISKRTTLLTPVLLGALFSLCEWVQSLGWGGFPWGQLALTQYKFLPFIQSLSLFGPYFLTFLIVAVNGYIALFLMCRQKSSLVIAMAMLFSNLAFGIVRCEVLPKAAESVDVAIVQPSVSSDEKWSMGREYHSLLDMHLKLSDKVSDAQLILWPETSLPYDLLSNESDMEDIRSFINVSGANILTGTFFFEDGKEYNAAAYITDTKEELYYKQHLVPFGEYVPWRGVIETLFPFLGDINMLSSDLSAGEESVVFDTANGKVGTLVCFDSIFSPLARDSVNNGAELLAIITNDSWYKDSTALYHHNAQAVFRAVENNRWVARCANTGVSSFIDSRGMPVYMSEPDTVCVHSQSVPLIEQKTLYTVTGNIFSIISILFIVGYVIADKRKSPH